MPVAEALMTAEEYSLLPDNGLPTELVRGRIVTATFPKPRHGEICATVVFILGTFVEKHELGHVLCNDSGVVTERDPDTVRGADVAYYSYQTVPKGRLPDTYLPVPPDSVFEVRSPGDTWREILVKVGEYLRAGVKRVCVLDQVPQTIHVYSADEPPQVFPPDAELVLDLLPGFRVAVARFFE